MILRSYQGNVQIEYKGLWLIQDSEQGAFDYAPPESFAGPLLEGGAFFLSRQFNPVISVQIEVHSSIPKFPERWEDVMPVQATYPSRRAVAWGPSYRGPDSLSAIEMPSVTVAMRAAANNRDGESGPETWLIQVWAD